MSKPIANLDNIVHTELYSLLTPIVSSECSQNHYQSISPEGLTELTENYTLTIMEYCMARIQIKINQEKNHTQQNPEKSKCEASVILSTWSHG